jgi:hypothetical protein
LLSLDDLTIAERDAALRNVDTIAGGRVLGIFDDFIIMMEEESLRDFERVMDLALHQKRYHDFQDPLADPLVIAARERLLTDSNKDLARKQLGRKIPQQGRINEAVFLAEAMDKRLKAIGKILKGKDDPNITQQYRAAIDKLSEISDKIDARLGLEPETVLRQSESGSPVNRKHLKLIRGGKKNIPRCP